MIGTDTTSSIKRAKNYCSELVDEVWENAALYSISVFFILVQMGVDYTAAYVGNYYLIFEVLIRFVALVMITCLFAFCEMSENGLNRT